MIHAENAPEPESKLYALLDSRRTKMVNRRKEFFRLTLDEIKDAVADCHSAEVRFTHSAEAAHYRQTLAMIEERAALARASLPPSPAKEAIKDRKLEFEKIKQRLQAAEPT